MRERKNETKDDFEVPGPVKTSRTTPGTDSIGLQPFQPPPPSLPPSTESLSDRAAFILAYCISLYASSRWAVNAYTYRQEKTFPT